ncbi:hypothetical protein ACJZ2D_011647 [Fusarium nematophilum]
MPNIAVPNQLPSSKSGTDTAVSQSLSVKSEKDCNELFLREVSALPEREAPASTASPTETQLTLSTRKDSPNVDSATRNNVWIARTVRTAMSNVLSGP